MDGFGLERGGFGLADGGREVRCWVVRVGSRKWVKWVPVWLDGVLGLRRWLVLRVMPAGWLVDRQIGRARDLRHDGAWRLPSDFRWSGGAMARWHLGAAEALAIWIFETANVLHLRAPALADEFLRVGLGGSRGKGNLYGMALLEAKVQFLAGWRR